MTRELLRTGLVALLGLAIPAFAARSAHPGTLNYVEGTVSIDGKAITPQSIGETDLRPGAVLQTQSGKAEILLTPGVFLRVGSNAAVRMDSAGLTDTRVSVDQGAALLEATEVHDENRIQVADSDLNTTVKKKGLYRFDGSRGSVSVLDGEAEVRQGDSVVKVKKGKEVVAGNATLTTQKFDRDAVKENDELYRWSSVRAKYLAEASAAAAQQIVVNTGGYYNPGWYWNSFGGGYSWLPGGSFYSPFGYGFSPWGYGYSPVYVVPRYRVVRPPVRVYPHSGFRGGAGRPMFRGRVR